MLVFSALSLNLTNLPGLDDPVIHEECSVEMFKEDIEEYKKTERVYVPGMVRKVASICGE